MAALFLVEFTIEYAGLTMDELLSIWLEEAKTAMASQGKIDVRQLWKITGERKIILIINISPDGLDKLLMGLPLMRKLGDQVQLNVTCLRSYESFANDVNNILSLTERYEYKPPNTNEGGLYYWLQFDVEYKGLELTEFYKIWAEEAKAALAAKSKGVVRDLWKCVGMRRVYALLCVDTPDMLDQISFNLPIMKIMGDHVKLTVKSVRLYENFYEDLLTWCAKK